MNNDLHIEQLIEDYLQGICTHEEVKIRLQQYGVIDSSEAIAMHKAAAVALQRNAVVTQVKEIHDQFVAGDKRLYPGKNNITKQPAKTIRINPAKWLLRVAAILILGAGAWFIYQYNKADSSNLYAEIYQPYHVNTDRAGIGNIILHNMIQHYKDRDYKAVISTFKSLPASNNREKFLAASALHETGQYPESIALLQDILRFNQQQGSRLYNDEAEFFTGLGYLKMKNGDSALPWFQKIYNDPAHTYHERISIWTITRLKWIK